MGVSSRDRSPPVIDSDVTKQQQQPQQHHPGVSFLEIEHDTYMMDPHCEKTPPPTPPPRLSSPPKRSRSSTSSSTGSDVDDDDKHVSFANLEIREYNQVLGDHPCCTVGPPVSLGWDYTQSPRVAVDDYEAKRTGRRRDRQALRLSLDKRREILSEVPDRDVRRVQRRLSRERCCDSKTIKTFFAATSVSE